MIWLRVQNCMFITCVFTETEGVLQPELKCTSVTKAWDFTVSCQLWRYSLTENILSATIWYFMCLITLTPTIGISLVNRWPPYHTISNHTIPSKQMTTIPYHNIPYQTNRWPPIKCHLVAWPLKGAGRIANQISAVTKGTSDLVNPLIQKTYQGNLLSATSTI